MDLGFDFHLHGTHRDFQWLTVELKTIKLAFLSAFEFLRVSILILYVEEILIYHETDFTFPRFDMSPGFRKDMFAASLKI